MIKLLKELLGSYLKVDKNEGKGNKMAVNRPKPIL